MKFSDQSAKHLSKCLASPRRPTEAAGCCEGSAARPRLEAGTPGTCALALRALLACKQLVHGECPSTAAQLDLLALCFPSGSQLPCLLPAGQFGTCLVASHSQPGFAIQQERELRISLNLLSKLTDLCSGLEFFRNPGAFN